MKYALTFKHVQIDIKGGGWYASELFSIII